MDKKTKVLFDALNAIAHIGAYFHPETGEPWDCNPIEVAQNAITEYQNFDDTGEWSFGNKNVIKED